MGNSAIGVHIPLPEAEGRRFVIADIHGCFYTFQEMVKRLKLTSDDQLFIAGDMINRGKRSNYVVDFILHLYTSGYKIFPIRGNHEQAALQGINDGFYPPIKKNGFKLFDEHGNIPGQYKVFFETLPHYITSGEDTMIVHAGLNFSGDPMSSYHDMLHIREFHYDAEKIEGRRLIHGHTPVNLEIIKFNIRNGSPVINLDNGCVFKDKIEGKGSLLALDLDSNELYIQENID